MIKTVNVMKEEDAAITGRHGVDDALYVETIGDACLRKIASAETAAGAFFRNVFHQMIERYYGQRAFAQMHQNSIDSQPVQPGGESGVATEGFDLAMQLEKCFLSQIFGERVVPYHAYANCEDVALVLRVEL